MCAGLGWEVSSTGPHGAARADARVPASSHVSPARFSMEEGVQSTQVYTKSPLLLKQSPRLGC